MNNMVTNLFYNIYQEETQRKQILIKIKFNKVEMDMLNQNVIHNVIILLRKKLPIFL